MRENYHLLPKTYRNFLRLISGQKNPPQGYSNHLKANPAFLTAPYQQANKKLLNVFAILVFGLLFTVNTAVAQCTPPVLVGTSNISQYGANVNWIITTGETYDLEVYTDAAFTTPFATYTGISGGSYTVDGVTAGLNYYYRVKVNGCTTYNTGNFAAANSYSPLDIASGYSADVIANGVGYASTSTTAPVDSNEYTYLTVGYKATAAATATTYGVPANRQLTSPNVTGLRYIMAPYNANNSLRVQTVNGTGTLTLAKPVQLSNIYLAETAGNGPCVVTVDVLFEDGTQQTTTGVSFTNWDSTAPAATPQIAGNLGRVSRNFNANPSTGNFKIFQVTIPITSGNQAKLVTGVKITKTSTATGATANLFAVSGQVIGTCPTIGTASTTATTFNSTTLNWNLVSPGYGFTSADVTYTVETFSDAAYTIPVGTPVTGITATTYNATGLSPNTAYYFRVKAINSSCNSAYATASATTPYPACITPTVPGAVSLTPSSSAVAGTITASDGTGYLVIRSTSATLSAGPVNNTTYTTSSTIGGGNVVSVGTGTTFNNTGLNGATIYYYFVYAYNTGATCVGPVYSTSASTASTTTCIAAPLIVGASNVKNSSANLNWTKVTGVGPDPITYTLEVYTDAGLTTPFTGSPFTLTTARQTLTGLTANVTYYWRVKAEQSGLCTSDWATSNFKAENTYTPIDVNGYTTDVIANGVGIANLSTTGAIDAVSNAYMSRDYKATAGSAAATFGLPLNRNLNGSISGLKFFLEDYAQNNSIRIAAQNSSATINLTVPLKLTDMYIAVTGGSGTATVTAAINFEDGSTQTTPNLTFQDWYQTNAATPNLATNLGRVNRENAIGAPESGNSKIFQVTIPILAANQEKKITGVTFTKTSTGATEPVANIFAISGKVIGDCPTMASANASSASYATATVNAVLATPGEGLTPADVWYKVEVFTNSDFTGAIVGSPFTTAAGTTSQAITGLTAVTTYYYRVTAVNAACESNVITGSFTTQPSCITPTGLNATNSGLTSGIVTWTAPTDAPANGYQYYYSTTNTAPAAGQATGVYDVPTGTTATITDLTPSTTYYVWVRSNCSESDKSAWSASTSFYTGYCTPTYSSCDTTHNISAVTVTGADTNFSDTIAAATACSAAGRDRTAQTIVVYPGQAYTFSATALGYIGVGVAADLNSNANFTDAGETLALPNFENGPAGTYTYNMSITIPADQAIGSYRLRIWNREANSGAGTSPCGAYVYGSYVDYTLSVQAVPECYKPTALTAVFNSPSATFSWSAPAFGPVPAGYEYVLSTSATAPVGNGTAVTAATFDTTVAEDTTYYLYVRTDCGGGNYSAWSVASYYTGYCTPTGVTAYYLNNVTTTNATENISNATGASTGGYSNYSATQVIQHYPGGAFNITLNTSSSDDNFFIWIDLNNDFDFADAGEAFVATTTYAASYSGAITLPTGISIGNHRMRVANSYIGAASYCGPSSYGEYEDYTLKVIPAPAACDTPDAPTAVALTPTSASIAGSITPSATAPTGYLVVRSTSATLSAGPVDSITYTAGNAIGGGTVAAVGASASFTNTGLSSNTQYYYFVYAYNTDGTNCVGPAYSAAATATTTTCVTAPALAAATDVTATSANVSWNAVLGATYTFEAYTDAGYTTSFASAIGVTATSYAFTDLTQGTTYYYRVKVDNAPGCTEYSTGSFTAQNSYTPLTVTGFNQDVIANGVGSAGTTTTAPVDANDAGANFAYLAADYQATAGATATGYGLPLSRTLTSAAPSGLNFVLADYSGNNSLRLQGATNGTLTLAAPQRLENLYLGVTSGNGNSSFSAEVLFNDGTSQLITGLVATNWDSNPATGNTSIVTNLGRVGRANGTATTGNFKIFQVNIAIGNANLTKKVTGVKIANTTSGASATQYILNVFSVSGKVSDTPCYLWTGAVDNNWNNTANWCGDTLPTTASDVTITTSSNNPVIASGVAYASNLTVEEGATLTVNSGATLSVENTIASSATTANLIVQDNGAIVQGTAATTNANTGKIAFHKNSNPLYRYDYTLWSSPITGQTLRTFAMGTSNNRFYVYDYADNGIEFDEGYWPVDPLATSFEAAKGYLIRMPNSVPGLTGYSEGTTPYTVDGTFTGTPNNGSYNAALIQTAGNSGFNAVGNPYPSPVSVTAFLTANSTNLVPDTGIWFWRKRNNSNNTSYLTLNLTGLVTPPGDTNGNGALDTDLAAYFTGNNTDWIIAPGQGFIVQAQSTATAVSFTNSMRRATPGAQAFFRTAAGTASRYWLNMVGQNGSGSQALVAYSENGTMSIDFGYDSKVFGAETSVSLYSLATDNKLAIQARPEFEAADVVPMGFTAPAAGQYTISIDHMDGVFAQGQNIYLKDLQEGVIRNLSEYDYTFTTEAGTFEGRFEVHYQTQALGTTPILDANSVIVFKQGNTIRINTGTALMSGVKVFDVRGRELYNQGGINAAETVISNLNVQQQVLIVEIATDKGTVSKRIVF